ncbi:nucleoside hydrolase [Plantactinospora endophytica]|uniref:Pyrimidine-specific ribonucleoside hydrolase RihA n=1 Tax=Plantactinospora endophytica TaxID=673535 RepID=A0ABQ4DUZ7_9ACTN|nr:nucleoside hydrolase [Plantactinospora endophytica]GIG86279.1 pyrimidine-specific ribonucleoside hydrolase RihA [Plantactinospora endophytica]
MVGVPVFLDCDPGHDDALAMLLAIASPEVEIAGISTVAGTAGVEATTRHALQVVELAGRPDIPVASGCGRPLVRDPVPVGELATAGMLTDLGLPEPRHGAVEPHAVELLARSVREHRDRLTVVCTAPLTNIALFLRMHPRLADRVHRLVLMGGSATLGNVTPSAEFNIWSDPEAAKIVLGSGLDITMAGLDVTFRAQILPDEAESLRTAGRCGEFVADILATVAARHSHYSNRPGTPLHDAVAVAEVLWPDLVEKVKCNVAVETGSALTFGRTVVDRWGVTTLERNVAYSANVDRDRFVERFVERVRRLP